MSNTFSVTVTSTEAPPAKIAAQYATVDGNGALILSDDPPFSPCAGALQVNTPKAVYAAGQWQSAIASTGAST